MLARAEVPKKQSVMIIGRDPGFCQVMNHLVQSPSRGVHEVSNSDEAIEVMDRHGSCQLALFDLEYSDEDALDTLRRIRRLHPNTAVVFITENTDIDQYLAAMDEGAFEYLPKPLQVGDFLRVVDRALSDEWPRDSQLSLAQSMSGCSFNRILLSC